MIVSPDVAPYVTESYENGVRMKARKTN